MAHDWRATIRGLRRLWPRRGEGERVNHRLRILYVAYPLLPVSERSSGGAEQVLLTLEREMLARGHETWVAAPQGSRVGGNLITTNRPASRVDEVERCQAEQLTAV